jgi:PAS domain S-box-containing protein
MGGVLAGGGYFEWPQQGWMLLYTLGHLASTLMMSGIAVYAWWSRDSSQARTLAVLSIGAAMWSGGGLFQLLTTNYLLARIAMQINYVGVGISIAGWMAFALAFTNRGELLTRRTAALLAVHSIVLNVLGSTNELLGHELIWQQVGPADTVYALTAEWGPGWYVHTVYSYLLLLAGTALILEYFVRHRNVYRSQAVAVLVGLTSCWLGNGLFITGIVSVDLTPLGFSITGLTIFWAIFRYELIDLTPIARDAAWDELEDAVVTIDEEHKIVDTNGAARAIFGAEGDCKGLPAAAFFDSVPETVLDQFAEAEEIDTQITTTIDGETRHFSLSLSPIDEQQTGRIIVLQDITTLKRREQELRTREEQLDVLRQVQSRVLRHNIRNELSMIQGNAKLLATEIDGEKQQRTRHVIEASDRLATISDKARIVEELFDRQHSLKEYDLRGCVAQAVTNVTSEYPELSVSVTGPGECPVNASPHLQIAVENLLENAVVHNDSERPRATVRIDDSDGLQLIVSDDGTGIPAQEITVLEERSESALEHGSGLGLWLVKWIANRSNATLEFETDAEGTDVIITFY